MRKTEEDYKTLAAERGFEWIGSMLPRNVNTPTRWRCPAGHEWDARYSTIQQGIGCRKCWVESIRKTEEDYKALAAERGFEWIGSLPKDVNTPTRWRCSAGHEWDARYGNIHEGCGCLQCWIESITAQPRPSERTEEDYKALAAERGFEWIGSLPKNVDTPALWCCSDGHEWSARYSSIQRGSGCPHCKTCDEDDYRSVAANRGFEWIGPELPDNTHKPTRWCCPLGHEWMATYANVRLGSGCPSCKSQSDE